MTDGYSLCKYVQDVCFILKWNSILGVLCVHSPDCNAEGVDFISHATRIIILAFWCVLLGIVTDNYMAAAYSFNFSEFNVKLFWF